MKERLNVVALLGFENSDRSNSDACLRQLCQNMVRCVLCTRPGSGTVLKSDPVRERFANPWECLGKVVVLEGW